jgi:hypothetical protein
MHYTHAVVGVALIIPDDAIRAIEIIHIYIPRRDWDSTPACGSLHPIQSVQIIQRDIPPHPKEPPVLWADPKRTEMRRKKRATATIAKVR